MIILTRQFHTKVVCTTAKKFMMACLVIIGTIGLTTGTSNAANWDIVQVTDNTVSDANPEILEGNVVWMSGDAPSWDIMLYDGSSIKNISMNGVVYEGFPKISGDLVVWYGGQKSGDLKPNEIYYYDGQTTQRLTYDTLADGSPQISGTNITWNKKSKYYGDYGIYLYDGHSTKQINTESGYNYSPSIDGSLISWAGNGNIWMYDGLTTSQLTNNNYTEYSPQVSGNCIAWNGIGGLNQNREAYLYDGSSIKQLTNTPEDEIEIGISGFRVAWIQTPDYGAGCAYATGNEVFIYDGSLDQIIQITDNDESDFYVKIKDDLVVWQGWDGNDWEIFTYNCITGVTDQITDNIYDDMYPATDGRSIVWKGVDQEGDWEIFLAVPEPSTLILMTLSGLALSRRRRN